MNIQVNRKTTEVNVPQLTYDIYDMQKQIMQDMSPKRFDCNANISIRGIQDLISQLGPEYWLYDGMTREDAANHLSTKAAQVGILDPHKIPLILTSRIECINPHFQGPTVVIETDEQGFRKIKVNILRECATMINRRSIFSNVAYALHLRYGVNLHLGSKDIRNATSMLGEWKGAEPLRHIFEEACQYYMNPTILPPNVFLRCQVPELRSLSDEGIDREVSKLLNGVGNGLYVHINDSIRRAIQIYEGTLINWYGDLT